MGHPLQFLREYLHQQIHHYLREHLFHLEQVQERVLPMDNLAMPLLAHLLVHHRAGLNLQAMEQHRDIA